MNFLTKTYGMITAIILIGLIPVFFIFKINIRKVVIAGFIYTIGLGNVLTELVGNRALTLKTSLTFDEAAMATGKTPVFEAITFLCFYYCLLIILARFLSNRTGKFRFERNSLWLFSGVLFFSLGRILSGFLGSAPYFNENLLLLPLLFFAILLAMPVDYEWVIKQIKIVFLVILWGSFIAYIVSPSWAAGTYGSSWLPGVNTRLYGLTPHPNILGPLAAIFLIMEARKKSRRRLVFDIVNGLVAIWVLIYAQSKTAWGALLLGYLALLLIRGFHQRFRGKYAWMLTAFLLVFLAVFSMAVINFPEILRLLQSNEAVYTFTGRLPVWKITLDVFGKNPLFGYGPRLWDLDFRMNLGEGRTFAGHAHNQFVHSLGETGLVGFSFLIFYWGVLFVSSIKISRMTNGMSVFFLVFLFIRSVSETPFENENLNFSFLVHLILFLIYLTAFYAQTRKSIKQNSPDIQAKEVSPLLS